MQVRALFFCLALLCSSSCGDGHDEGGAAWEEERETASCPSVAVEPSQTLSPIKGVWGEEVAEGYWVISQVVPPKLPNLIEWEVSRFCLRTITQRMRGRGYLEFFTLTNEVTLHLDVREGRHASETLTWRGPMEQLFPPALRDVELGGDIKVDVGGESE